MRFAIALLAMLAFNAHAVESPTMEGWEMNKELSLGSAEVIAFYAISSILITDIIYNGGVWRCKEYLGMGFKKPNHCSLKQHKSN